jgi:hypothetical protein
MKPSTQLSAARIANTFAPGLLLLLATLTLALGCPGAELTIHKIPTPTQYHNPWTDADQAKADAIPGFRYFLPRTYVAVTNEFPFDSEDVYVQGTLSPDGAFIELDEAALRAANFPSTFSSAIPVTSFFLSNASTTGLQSSTKGKGSADGGTPTNEAAADGGTGLKADLSATATSGLIELKGPFDIVTLQDYDEQYAVEVKGGFASAELNMSLFSGWRLDSTQAKIDNAAFGRLLTDQIGKFLDLLAQIASKAIPLPAAGGAPSAGGLQGLLGRPVKAQPVHVLIRIRTIYYAVPGLYPLLKPRELKELYERIAKPEGRPASLDNNAIGLLQARLFVTPLYGSAVQFHTRSERLLEVVRTSTPPAASPANLGSSTPNCGPAPNLIRAATSALFNAKISLKIHDVTKCDGSITIYLDPTGIDVSKKQEFLEQAKTAFQKTSSLKSAKIQWAAALKG